MKSSLLSAWSLIAIIGLTLAGCDAAEESAQKLTEKAEQAVQQLAREAVSDTAKAFNEQIDKAQKSTSELLGQPEDEAQRDERERDRKLEKEGVET